MIKLTATILCVLHWGIVRADSPVTIHVVRSKKNPMITTKTPHAGNNICGPSVIRVPKWIEKPLGKYHMYFAHHSSSSMSGAYIRMAYADSPEGPWTVLKGGTLKRSELKDKGHKKSSYGRKRQHIASPDAHVDHENRQIVLYFHGSYRGHNTGAAISKDGIRFEDVDVDMGGAYLRTFNHNGQYYGLYQGRGGKGPRPANLWKFDGPFKVMREEGKVDIIPPVGQAYVRHLAVLQQREQLIVFYTRIGDTPERILASVVLLAGDWKTWKASAPIEVIRPERPYEGGDLPVQTSKAGTARNVHQLRDPCIFVDDDDSIYLYYCIKGECGIACARLEVK